MSVVSVRVPNLLHEQLKELALKEGITVNQYILLAIAEKVASTSIIGYLEKRPKGGDREKVLSRLNKAPEIDPEESDM
jgi:hypothetical protein